MNKQELSERLAKQSRQSPGKAADTVDTLLYRLLKDLKRTPVKPQTDQENKPSKSRSAKEQ